MAYDLGLVPTAKEAESAPEKDAYAEAIKASMTPEEVMYVSVRRISARLDIVMARCMALRLFGPTLSEGERKTENVELAREARDLAVMFEQFTKYAHENSEDPAVVEWAEMAPAGLDYLKETLE